MRPQRQQAAESRKSVRQQELVHHRANRESRLVTSWLFRKQMLAHAASAPDIYTHSHSSTAPHAHIQRDADIPVRTTRAVRMRFLLRGSIDGNGGGTSAATCPMFFCPWLWIECRVAPTCMGFSMSGVKGKARDCGDFLPRRPRPDGVTNCISGCFQILIG